MSTHVAKVDSNNGDMDTGVIFYDVTLLNCDTSSRLSTSRNFVLVESASSYVVRVESDNFSPFPPRNIDSRLR